MPRARALLLLTIVTSGFAFGEDWPTLHRDPNRTGVSGEGWTKTALQVAWAAEADAESVDASPAVVGDRVYVGGACGGVTCLNAADGAVVWGAQTGGAVMSSPTVADGRVFIGSGDRCLYAFDAVDGTRLWRVRTRGAVVASPLVLADRVYCGSMDGTFRCVQAADGSEVWRQREQGGIGASAAAAGDLVYYGDEAGNIIARNTSDGGQVLAVKVQGAIVAAPCVTGERLIVPVMSPTALSPPNIKCLLVLDRQTGNEVWSLTQGSSVLHTPVSDGQNAYFATVSGYLSDTELIARRLADGAEVWKRRLGGVADSSPALAGDYLLFGNHDMSFHIVHRATGADVLTLPLGGRVFSSPAIANGSVYIGVQGGKVVCLR